MSLRAWAIRSHWASTWPRAPARSATGSPQLGRMTRTALADVKGWRVVEPLDEPTAITTLAPVDGADPQKVRAWLIAERGIVTTYAEVQRAPFEMTTPVLRVSPHVDTTAEDLELSPRRWPLRRRRASRLCARPADRPGT